jgi:hypothetical protein
MLDTRFSKEGKSCIERMRPFHVIVVVVVWVVWPWEMGFDT